MSRTIVYLLLLCAALPPRGALAEGIGFVVNSAGASVSLVDMTGLKEIRRIPVLREPHHLALSPDRRSLLVGDTVGNEIMFLDPNTGALQKRLPVADPYQLGFSPDGKLLTVNGLARNQVDIYDAATLTLLKRFAVASTPSHLDYAPDSSAVYVSLQDSDRLIALNLRTMTVSWSTPVGKTPAGVLFHKGKILVADMGTAHLAQIDPNDGRVVAEIPAGRGAHQLFLSPDRKTIWVNNRAEGTTMSLDAATLKQIRTYRIPGGPDDIAFAPDGKLWITRRWAEKVAVLDPATGDYQNVTVGRSPHGIFLSPAASVSAAVASR